MKKALGRERTDGGEERRRVERREEGQEIQRKKRQKRRKQKKEKGGEERRGEIRGVKSTKGRGIREEEKDGRRGQIWRWRYGGDNKKIQKVNTV